MSEIDDERLLAIKKLNALVDEGLSEKGLLSEMELEAETQKQALGQRLMDEKLSLLRPEDGKPKACPRCGRRSKRRATNIERRFRSLSGEHTLKRDYYYCDGCSAGFYPRDLLLGLPERGDVSVELERRMADFAVTDTFEVASERWNMHYSLKVSSNQFRQIILRLGGALEMADKNPTLLHTSLKKPETSAAETLYVMNDGGMVPMRGEWKECKMGLCFRDDAHVKGDQIHRGQIAQARYVAVLGGQEEFKKEMEQALFIENAVRAKRIVWVADGAIGNWALASVLAPRAIQILDWHHAVQHATDCAKVLFGETDAIGTSAWKSSVEHLLRTDVRRLISELKECQLQSDLEAHRKALSQLVDYYENNQSRMNYAEYLKIGLIVGSGPVESAHRHVIQARMKRAGQHWSERGAKRMAKIRAAYKTAGPSRFYDAIRWAARRGSRVKKLPMFEKRRASNR